jgi:hypothetical protein
MRPGRFHSVFIKRMLTESFLKAVNTNKKGQGLSQEKARRLALMTAMKEGRKVASRRSKKSVGLNPGFRDPEIAIHKITFRAMISTPNQIFYPCPISNFSLLHLIQYPIYGRMHRTLKFDAVLCERPSIGVMVFAFGSLSQNRAKQKGTVCNSRAVVLL